MAANLEQRWTEVKGYDQPRGFGPCLSSDLNTAAPCQAGQVYFILLALLCTMYIAVSGDIQSWTWKRLKSTI